MEAGETEFTLRPLQAGDTVTSLSLGDSAFTPLKDFLRKHAKKYHDNHLARTWVIVDPGGKIASYVTLVCGQVELREEAEQLVAGELDYRYKEYPALKIARLATDRRFRGKGLAQKLVEFSIGVAIEDICPSVGCRFIILDAKKQSIKFYTEKCGFTILNTADNKSRESPIMFIDLAKL